MGVGCHCGDDDGDGEVVAVSRPAQTKAVIFGYES
jgi:hypothetical protein